MNEVEKEAIEFFKEYIRNNEKMYYTIEIIENLSILLSLVEKQQKEIELKDEVIDEMSTYMDVAFSSAQLSRLLKQEILPLEIYKHDIKQYFLDKVKGNKND